MIRWGHSKSLAHAGLHLGLLNLLSTWASQGRCISLARVQPHWAGPQVPGDVHPPAFPLHCGGWGGAISGSRSPAHSALWCHVRQEPGRP